MPLRDDAAAVVTRVQRAAATIMLYWVDTAKHTEVNLTAHAMVRANSTADSPQMGCTVYLISNLKIEDLTAFAKERLGPHGEAGSIELLAQRPDAELAQFEINKDGTEATR